MFNPVDAFSRMVWQQCLYGLSNVCVVPLDHRACESNYGAEKRTCSNVVMRQDAFPYLFAVLIEMRDKHVQIRH